MRTTTRSQQIFETAQTVLPGGVNSPVRAFGSVGGNPLIVERAEGPYLFDVDQNRYIDLVGSWGPMLVGHNHPKVIQAVEQTVRQGLSFGTTCPLEIELAQKIQEFYPTMQRLRLVSSGTESCMSALRLARGFTGKPAIIKFSGCYHGHSDCLLAKAGSGLATMGVPSSAGVPPSLTQDTLTLPFNNLEAVTTLLQNRDDIAAIILEPVAGNMGCIPPQPKFLEGLRTLTKKHGIVLIFDEVMAGFRIALGGAKERYDVEPDLYCLGKVVGGGMPLAAYGGKKEIMEHVAPLGNVYQAGTLSGNPVSSAAGLATLKLLQSDASLFVQAEKAATAIRTAMDDTIALHRLPYSTSQVGTMFTLFFRSEAPVNFDQAQECDTKLFAKYFQAMLNQGIYLPPSQFEANFANAALSDEEIATICNSIKEILPSL